MSLMLERIGLPFLKEAPFTAADRMIVQHLQEDWGESNKWILLAAALCNLSAREGHAYFDLQQARQVPNAIASSWPSLRDWQAFAERSSVFSPEANASRTPLILADTHCLYLEKYYSFERKLAGLLSGRIPRQSTGVAGDPVDQAARSHFFVITGGPGTGKTTLALRYLNRLLDEWNEPRPPRFAAVAPTGKAAARLGESMSNGVKRLELGEERTCQLLSIPCLTIHRLLGALPHRSRFRSNERSPIRFDVLVIDESSMIDLPLMLRLFEALPEHCRILMLGDKDQLASVNVGSVFSDVLEAAETKGSPLCHSVQKLVKTYRFSEDSKIFEACQLARTGAEERFAELMAEAHPDFQCFELKPEQKRISKAPLLRSLEAWRTLRSCPSPAEALERLTDYVTLMPTRQGAFGATAFNQQVERLARQDCAMEPLSSAPLHAAPIMILENDYEQELYNGDLGVIWAEAGKQALACFESSEGELRTFRLSELPRNEFAFALTIHKSQGSEFEEVACVFAPEGDAQLTRELVYTAFSRAKKKVCVWANRANLAESISRQANRATRLAKLLQV